MSMIVTPIVKTTLWGILWVFVLSFEVQQRSLFSYANEYLVRNQLVETSRYELAEIWGHLRDSLMGGEKQKTAVRTIQTNRH